jgi:hypothetical protein
MSRIGLSVTPGGGDWILEQVQNDNADGLGGADSGISAYDLQLAAEEAGGPCCW